MRRGPADPSEVRAAVAAAVDQFVAATAAARTPDRVVPATPSWTVCDVTAHLLTAVDRYAAGPVTGMRRVADPTELPALNGALLAERSWPPLPELLAELRTRVAALLDQIEGYDDQQPSYLFNGDRTVRADRALGILLAELLVHGSDVAAIAGRRVRVTASDLEIVLDGLQQVLPGWVNAARCRNHTAAYDIRVRGGARYNWRFTEGTLSFEPPDDHGYSCHISAQPAALLQVMYRRRSPWSAAATGKVIAWGVRPWLALSLASRFHPA